MRSSTLVLVVVVLLVVLLVLVLVLVLVLTTPRRAVRAGWDRRAPWTG